MLNNSFTTKAIVTKYVTAVKDLAKRAGVHSENYPLAANEPEFYSPHQQLVAKLWFDHEGCPKEHPFLDKLSHYMDFFKKSLITEEEYTFLLEHYEDTIDFIFSDRENWDFRISVEDNEPIEFAELASELYQLKNGKTIFIPFCGYGDFVLKFPKCRIIGTVEDETVAVFTQIRLDAAGFSSNIVARTFSDGMTNPEEKVDAVLCDMRSIGGQMSAFFEDCTLEKLYDTLTDTGCMIAVCSNDILTSTRKGDTKFRKKIHNDKSIDAVITLPEGIFFDSSVTSFLLCLDKSKESDKKHILMYNASFAARSFSAKSTLKGLDVNVLLSTIEESKNPKYEDIIRFIPYTDVDPDLMIPDYYLMKGKYRSKRSLADIVDIVNPINNALILTGDYDRSITSGSLVKPYCYTVKEGLTSDFAKARFCGERKDQSIYKTSDLDGCFYYPVKPCIFIALTGKSVNLCYCDKENTDALCALPYAMTCLTVKEGFTLEYVAALLLSESITEQLLALARGSVIRQINQKLLTAVAVPEHRSEQKSKFLVDALKESLSQREQELALERENFARKVRLRKHALTQSVSAFSALFNTLNMCRIRQGGILHDEDKISPISDRTVAVAFDTLSTRMSSILEKLAHIADVDIDFGDSEYIDPEDFILQYIKSKKNGWVNFTGVSSWDSTSSRNKSKKEIRNPEDNGLIIREGDALCSFLFPKAALEHIFNNIVANAIAHGFTDQNRPDYKVRFSWESQGLDIVITIENNGNPLPEGVNSKDVLSYGYSTKLNVDGHNGIGGSEIANIMQDFQGDVEVLSCPGTEYPVKYILRFHNSNIVGTF